MMTSLDSLQQGNVKNSKKPIKILNIEGENLRMFWSIWGISMEFYGKAWLMIILKVRKNHGFTLSLEITFLVKTTGGSNWPISLFRVNVLLFWLVFIYGKTKIWIMHCPTYAKYVHFLQSFLMEVVSEFRCLYFVYFCLYFR